MPIASCRIHDSKFSCVSSSSLGTDGSSWPKMEKNCVYVSCLLQLWSWSCQAQLIKLFLHLVAGSACVRIVIYTATKVDYEFLTKSFRQHLISNDFINFVSSLQCVWSVACQSRIYRVVIVGPPSYLFSLHGLEWCIYNICRR